MPRPPTTIPLNEDHPRLTYGTLKRAGLNPGKVTLWAWNTPAAALAIRVAGGGNGSFTIVGSGGEVRVVCRLRYLICPACGRLCRYLLFREEWGCRLCRGV